MQSLPVRDAGLGIPPSGPMDPLAFQAANLIAGNDASCEGLELVIPPGSLKRNNTLAFSAVFHVRAAVSITGASAEVTLDGAEVPMWSKITVNAGSKLNIGGTVLSAEDDNLNRTGGLRAYLSIRGGLPGIPTYLGSKSTSMGSGGFQVSFVNAHSALELTKAYREGLCEPAICFS